VDWSNFIRMLKNICKFSKIVKRLHIPSGEEDRTNPSAESRISNGWLKHRVGAKILIKECRHRFNKIRSHLNLALLIPAQFEKTRSTRTLVRAIS
jgi:hypothetical protein